MSAARRRATTAHHPGVMSNVPATSWFVSMDLRAEINEVNLHECYARLALGQSLPLDMQEQLVVALQDLELAASNVDSVDPEDTLAGTIAALDAAVKEANKEKDEHEAECDAKVNAAEADLQKEREEGEKLRAEIAETADQLRARAEEAEHRLEEALARLAEPNGSNVVGIKQAAALREARLLLEQARSENRVLAADVARLEQRLSAAGGERSRAHQVMNGRLEVSMREAGEWRAHAELLEKRIVESAGTRRRSK